MRKLFTVLVFSCFYQFALAQCPPPVPSIEVTPGQSCYDPVTDSLCVLIENTSPTKPATDTWEWRITTDQGDTIPPYDTVTHQLNFCFSSADGNGPIIILTRKRDGCFIPSTGGTGVAIYEISVDLSADPAGPFCDGETPTIQLIAEPSASANDPITYTWGHVPDNNDTVSASPVTTTTYDVSIEDNFGCKADTNITVTFNPLPVADPGADIEVCIGACDSITAAGAFAKYYWIEQASGDTLDSTQTFGVCPLATTVYELIVIDSNGCVSVPEPITVTVNDPDAIAGNADGADNIGPICPFTTTAIPSSALGGSGGYTYFWFPSSGLDDSTKANPDVTPGTSSWYYLYVQDASGCFSDTDSVFVQVHPEPSFTVDRPSVCESDPPANKEVDITMITPNGGFYQWEDLTPAANYALITATNGNDSTVVTVDFNGQPAGTYTFNVIATDSVTGCVDTVRIDYVVDPPVNITVNGPLSMCPGDSVQLVVTAPGGSVFDWDAIPADPSLTAAKEAISNPFVSPLVSTRYPISVTGGSCEANDTVDVTVFPQITAGIDPVPDLCGCDTITLDTNNTTSGAVYIWTVLSGSANIFDSTAATTEAFVCATSQIGLLVADPFTGCGDTATITIVSNQQPDAEMAFDKPTVCGSVTTTVQLNGSGSNTNPGTTYLWTASAPASFVGAANDTVATLDVVGETFVTFTVTDSTGCDSTVSDTIKVFPEPTLTTTPNSFCANDPKPWVADVFVNGAAAGSVYDWGRVPACVDTLSAPLDSSLETFDFSVCLPGIDSFEVRVTDGITGCVDTVFPTIEIVNIVSVTTNTSDTTICADGSLLLTASGAVNYNWHNITTGSASPANLLLSGQGEDSLLIPDTLSPGIHFFQVAGSGGGCVDSATVRVVVNDAPTPGAGANQNICAEDSILLAATGSGGSFEWFELSTDTSVGTGATVSFPLTTAGVESFYVVETNGSGCTGSDTMQVSIKANPVITINNPAPGQTVCIGTQVTITSQPLSAGQFTFSWLPGGQSTQTITPTPPATTTYTVTITDTSGAISCSTSDSVEITVNLLPTVAISAAPNDTLCEGETLTLTGAGANSYTWNPGNFNGNPFVVIPPTGTTQYVLEGTDGNSCTSNDTINIVVSEQPEAFAGSNDTLCQTESYPLTAATGSGASFMWTANPPAAGSFDDPTDLNTTFEPFTLFNGDVTLTLTASNSPCADSSHSFTLTLTPGPASFIDTDTVVVCAAEMITFNAIGDNSTSSWTDNGAGGSFSDANNDTTNYTVPVVGGTYELMMIVADTLGCPADTDRVYVVVIDSAAVFAGNPFAVCMSDSIPLDSATADADSVRWTASEPGTFVPSATALNPVFLITDTTFTGTVTLSLTGMRSPCLDSTHTVNILVNPPPVANIAEDTLAVCSGNAITLNGTAANGNPFWTDGNFAGTFADSLNDTTVYNAATTAGIDSLLLTVVDPDGGCPSDSDKVYLDIKAPPVANVNGDDSLCQATVYIPVATASGEAFSWTYSPVAAGGSFSDSAVVNATFTPAPAYTGQLELTLTAFNSPCPADSDSVIIEVITGPVALIGSGDTVAVCESAPASLTATVLNGTAQWSDNGAGGNFSAPTTANTTYTAPDTGCYMITLTVTGTGGPCPDMVDTVWVCSRLAPVADAGTGPALTCRGLPYTLADATSNVANVTWTVSPVGAGTFADANDLNTDFIPAPAFIGSATLTLTATNPPCGNDVSTLNITVQDGPFAGINAPDTVALCIGEDLQDLNGTVINGTPQWSDNGSGGVFSDATNDTTDYTPPGVGQYTIYFEVLGGGGGNCISSIDSLILIVRPEPVADIGIADTLVCQARTVTFPLVPGNNIGSEFMWTAVPADSGSFSAPAALTATYTPVPTFTGPVMLYLQAMNDPCTPAIDSVEVEYQPGPVGIISQDTLNLCDGQPSPDLSALVLNGDPQWSGDGSFAAPTASTTGYTPPATVGTYSVILTVTDIRNPVCPTFTDTLIVIVNEIPVADVSLSSDTTCQAVPVTPTVTAAGTSFMWEATPANSGIFDDPSASATTFRPDNNYTGPVTLKLTAISASCSSDSDMVSFEIVEGPVADINQGDTANVCEGLGIDLNAVVLNGNPVWDDGGAGGLFTSKTSDTINYTPPDTGCYMVYLTVTGSGSCPAMVDTVYVCSKVQPFAFAGSNITICRGKSHDLTDAVANVPNVFWTASPATAGTFNDPNDLNTTFRPDPDFIGVVTLSLTASNSPCSNVVSAKTVVVEDGPLAQINMPDTNYLCIGETFMNVTGTALNGVPQWSDGNANGLFTAPNDTVTHYTPQDTGKVMIYFTVSNIGPANCQASVDSICLFVRPKPVANIGIADTALCMSDILSLPLVPANGIGSEFLWTSVPDTGEITNPNSLTTQYIPDPQYVGTVTLYLIAMNNPCASNTDSIVVNILRSPVARILEDTFTVCEGDVITDLSGIIANGDPLWSGDGSFSDPVGDTTDYTPPATPGMYKIKLTVSDTVGSICPVAEDSAQVVVNRIPTAAISVPSDSACQGVPFAVNGTAPVGDVLWSSTGTGTFLFNTSDTTIYIPGIDDTGIVTLTMLVRNDPCDSAVATKDIYILETPRVQSITVTEDTICYNDQTVLKASATGTGPLSYIWLPDSIVTTADSLVVTPDSTTEYSVMVANPFCSIISDTITVVVEPPGVPDPGADQVVCIGDNVNLNGSFSSNANGAFWSTNGTGSFVPDTMDLNAVYIPGAADTAAGEVDIYLTTTGACFNLTDTVTITIDPRPVVMAGEDIEFNLGSSIILQGAVTNATGATWETTGSGSFVPSKDAVNATYVPSNQDLFDADDTLRLILSSTGGCTVVSDTLRLILSDVIIPNVITPYPLSPGANDVLKILGLPEGATLVIFNRWGRKVYESSHYLNDWDAEGVVDGTYYYILQFEDRSWTGHVRVIKEER